MSERHTDAQALFLAAMPLTEEDRTHLLDRACADNPSLRAEVESLLLANAPTSVSGASERTTPFQAHLSHSPTGPDGRFDLGQVFAGRYRIVSEIGRGGMGQVFRAHDMMLDQPIALKLLPEGSRIDRRQLLHEVRLARQVTHPNVCRVFDCGEDGSETYLTMEYVEGEDLASLLGRIGTIPDAKLIDISHQLCAGLAAAHASGVLHRDLKPANVLLDQRGQVRITDFGIASSTETDGDTAVAGTPAYVAPERWHGTPASIQSDLYALGVLLYELAAGRAPFRARTFVEFAKLHNTATPSPPSVTHGRVDPILEAVIMQCLEKAPEDRPASARAIAAALPGGDSLQRYVDAGETPSPDLVAQAQPTRALSRRASAWGLAVLISLLVLLPLAGDRAFPSRAPWSSKPPIVLADRAASILTAAGHELDPVDRAWGYRPNPDGVSPDEGVSFWYRQGEEWMWPTDLDEMDLETRVAYYDPPPIHAGDVQMLLDARGRLVTLKVLGAYFDGVPLDGLAIQPDAPTSAEAITAMHRAVLSAAGFDFETLESVEPDRRPPMFVDRVDAWRTTDDDTERRVIVGTIADRVMFFDQHPAEMADEHETEAFFTTVAEWYWTIMMTVSVVLTLVIAFVARHTVRSGRGDLRGARLVATFIVACGLARWLINSDHLPELDAELQRLLFAGGQALLQGLAAGLAYIALEPMVRRTRPRALIAWTRLLHGRWRDPVVGRALLVGAVAGAGWAALTALDRIAAAYRGIVDVRDPLIEFQLDAALSLTHTISAVLGTAVSAVGLGLTGLFLLIGLRVLTLRPALAVAAFIVIQGTIETLGGIHPAISWLPLGLGIAVTSVVLLSRYGLLSYVVAWFCFQLLIMGPVTLATTSWYAGTGLFSLLLVATLGLFGFLHARAGTAAIASPLSRPANLS